MGNKKRCIKCGEFLIECLSDYEINDFIIKNTPMLQCANKNCSSYSEGYLIPYVWDKTLDLLSGANEKIIYYK